MTRMESIKKPRVAIASGTTREVAVRNALELVRDDILAKVRGRVLIKPNFLSSTKPLASTQTGAVLPVLELLNDADVDSIVIGEGAAHSTRTAFKNFGYEGLAREFDVKLIDLNHVNFNHEFEILTQTRGTQKIQYADIAASSDTIISE